MKNKKRSVLSCLLCGAIAIGSASASLNVQEANAQAKAFKKKPANVIFMVMDGTSAGATTLARWYKGGSLALDRLAAGAVRTYSAESAITDSAPAATAMATGFKTNDKLIGLLPAVATTPGVPAVNEKDILKPVSTLVEAAKREGKATGVIATSEIQHATPAAFSSHVPHRNNFPDIAEQQVYQGMDVVLGGGGQSLLPGQEAQSRKDGENLVEEIKKNGYDYVDNRTALNKSTSSKIWGAFAAKDLAYDMDREKIAPSQPTLAEMTKKAIQTLSRNKKGFFMMVEGSKPDWAAHANETIGVISEVLAFDNAVKEAVDFAKKDGNTLVLAVTDHANSGITLGNADTDSSYPSTPVSAYMDPLKKAKLTLEGSLHYLKDDRSNLKEVAELYGLASLTDEELNTLRSAKNIGPAMSSILSKRAHIGFITTGHTGEDVFLYSFGPNRPVGTFENSDLAKIAEKFMGLSLADTTNALFKEADTLFKTKGYETFVDRTNPDNLVFTARKQGKLIQLPQNKNYLLKNGRIVQLPGVTVFNGKQFYVSSQALSVAEK
ncbi:alkaline phosphatase [Bacillus sp. 1P06AnD]